MRSCFGINYFTSYEYFTNYKLIIIQEGRWGLVSVRVLLVDDSAVIRGLMTRALERDPAIEIVGTAASGKMAIDVSKKLKPDVIILDIEMPEMDGLTAVPELLKVSPSSKIIMSSAITRTNASLNFKALELGATDYLTKPSSKDGIEVEVFYRELTEKVKVIGSKEVKPRVVYTPVAEVVKPQVNAVQLVDTAHIPLLS